MAGLVFYCIYKLLYIMTDFKTCIEDRRGTMAKGNKKLKTKKISKKKVGKSKYNSNISIKTKLIAFFIILSVIPVAIVGFYSIFNAEKSIENKVSVLSEQLSKQNSQILNGKLRELKRSMDLIAANTEIIELVSKNEYEDSFERYQDQQKLREEFTAFMLTYEDIRSITIYKANSEILEFGTHKALRDFLKKGEFKKTKTYEKVMEKNDEIEWVTGLDGAYDRIYLMRKISSYKQIGIIIYEMDLKNIEEIFKEVSLGGNSKVFVADNLKNIIYHQNNEEIGKVLSEDYVANISEEKEVGSFIDKDKLVAYSNCINGWKVYSEIPLNYLTGDIHNVAKWTGLIIIICIILSVIFSIYIALSISRPIEMVSDLMKKAGDGDLTAKANIEGKNEIGKLAIGFNQMMQNMKSMIRSTSEAFDSVHENTLNMGEVAQQYSSVAEQIAISVGEIANGASQQAKDAEDTTMVMDQLSTRIDHVVNNIRVVSQATGKTKEVSNNASKTVKDLYDKTEEYAQISIASKNNILKLKESASEIIDMVSLIENISEQTNLLALNAAIEAARSGEAGKGFAVVADEIRKLAEESGEASREINKLANNIDIDVTNTVNVVDKGERVFNDQHLAVLDTDTAFKDIKNAIEVIISEIQEVGNAVDDIIEYKNKTIDSIQNIAAVSQQAAAGTEEVMAASQEQSGSSEQLLEISIELKKLVKELNESMDEFKV